MSFCCLKATKKGGIMYPCIQFFQGYSLKVAGYYILQLLYYWDYQSKTQDNELITCTVPSWTQRNKRTATWSLNHHNVKGL